ncbi:MAG: sulfotransferase family protein [Phycisphaerales bacterium JB063]
MPDTLPNTLIVGAMKASTTLLYTMLGRHPRVWFPHEKEPHYFTAPDYDADAAWDKYRALFASCPADATVIAEASTNYTKQPHFGDTPGRIRGKLGEPKLVYILRDPVARTISNYRHSYVTHQYPEGTTAEQALDRDPILLDASRYALQLDAYHREFGEGSVHVVIAEQLHDDPMGVMSRLAAFLGIDPIDDWKHTPEAVNAIGELAASDRADRLLGPAMRRRIAALIPGPIKQRIKRAAARDVPVPDVAPATRDRIYHAIEDDLARLHTMLGAAIEGWPSTQRLTGKTHAKPAPAA